MSVHENETGSAFIGLVSAGAARDLLTLCVADRGGGFEGLCKRLDGSGGDTWAEGVLADSSVGDGTSGLDVVIRGVGGPLGPERLKHLGKKAAVGAVSGDDEARALFLYLSATAAALAHKGALISSRDPSMLLELLTDLVERVPAQLRGPFCDAASTLRGILGKP